VIVIIEIRNQKLKHTVGGRGWFRNGLEDLVKQGPQVGALIGEITLCDAVASYGVNDRKIDLFLDGIEIDEQVKYLADDLVSACILSMYLVDDYDRGKLLG